MDGECLRSVPVGPQFLDVRSMIGDFPGLQTRVLKASAEVKQLYDRSTNTVYDILQLQSENQLAKAIPLPYIPKQMHRANIGRIPKEEYTDPTGNVIVIEPSIVVRYGPNEIMPFKNQNSFDGFYTMAPTQFEMHAQAILDAKTREECRRAIDTLNASNPGPSLTQIISLIPKIKGSFGKEARCYLASLCGINQATRAMGAIQPDQLKPTLTEEEQRARPEDVYTLIDALPSMEEREIVSAALCGTAAEAVAVITKTLDALVLGRLSDQLQNQANEYADGPDVVADDATVSSPQMATPQQRMQQQQQQQQQPVVNNNPYSNSAYGYSAPAAPVPQPVNNMSPEVAQQQIPPEMVASQPAQQTQVDDYEGFEINVGEDDEGFN